MNMPDNYNYYVVGGKTADKIAEYEGLLRSFAHKSNAFAGKYGVNVLNTFDDGNKISVVSAVFFAAAAPKGWSRDVERRSVIPNTYLRVGREMDDEIRQLKVINFGLFANRIYKNKDVPQSFYFDRAEYTQAKDGQIILRAPTNLSHGLCPPDSKQIDLSVVRMHFSTVELLGDNFKSEKLKTYPFMPKRDEVSLMMLYNGAAENAHRNCQNLNKVEFPPVTPVSLRDILDEKILPYIPFVK